MQFGQKLFIFSSICYLLIIRDSLALEATYYSESFQGAKTSFGDTYHSDEHTAAICGQTLGSYSYISSAQTGIVVTLNDRPNCTKYPEVIDLSERAFELFAPTSRGRITDISSTLIGNREFGVNKKTFSRDVFSSLGVELIQPLSNTYFTRDSVLIEGKITNKKEYVMVYLEHEETKEKLSFLRKVDSYGKFRFVLPLPKLSGKYIFVLASGNSFETSTPESLVLIDESTLQYPHIRQENTRAKPLFEDGEEPFIRLPYNTWGELYIKQGKRVVRVTGKDALSFPDDIRLGKAQVSLDLFELSTPSSLDRNISLGKVWSGNVIFDKKRDITGKSKVNIRNRKGSFVFQFRGELGQKIRSTYYVTMPDGEVKEYNFPKKWLDESGYIKPGILITGTFPAITEGTYRLETVLDNGYAYFNIPLTQGTVWGIIPTITKEEKMTISEEKEKVQNTVFARINSLRSGLGRSSLTLDADLMEIAQKKAQNMADDNYVGHWTKEGYDILEFAKSLSLPHPNSMAENVAGGNVSHLVLQEGLEESGSHRYAMVNPEWKKIGIGYVVKNKKSYLVQVFGN